MIDDIIYDSREFILEIPIGVAGGRITSYSLDGSSYDISIQTSHVFIT
jgi:hypothetical protein